MITAFHCQGEGISARSFAMARPGVAQPLSTNTCTYCNDFRVLHCIGLYCCVVAETCSYQEPLVASVNDVSAVDSTGSDATSAVQGSGQIWVSKTTVSDTIRFTINSVDVPTIAVVR